MSVREITLTELPPDHPVAVFGRFWEEVAEGKSWVPWSRFDAVEHPGVLPWMLLLKSEPAGEEGVRWRFVVCGTGCSELFGFSYQGKLFGTGIPAEAAADRLAEFRRVVDGAGPLYFDSTLPIPSREFVRVLRGIFPFSTKGGEIDRLFLVVAQESTRAR